MHIPEKRSRRVKFSKVGLTATVIFMVLLATRWWYLSWAKITVVPQEQVIIAMVEQGELVREVNAPGILVPIAPNYLSATSSGRVKQILVEASDTVEVGTLIMLLDNPELIQAVDDAKFNVQVLTTSYQSLEQKWRQSILKQRISVADFNARYEMARLRRAANNKLLGTGAVSDLDYNESILQEQQLKLQHRLEAQLLDMLPELKQAELSAAQTQIDKAKRHLALQEELAEDLYVRSTIKGVVQEVSLQVGEPFKVGTVLARVAVQDNLKAELHVQESQVKEVTKGQSVLLSASGNQAHGIVQRINPAVENGVVKVDVLFNQDDVLAGARPDLRITGVISLERVNNVLKLKRPAFVQENSSSSLFVLNHNQNAAVRKQISFGRGSLNDIEILNTLNVGDRVIVSSTNEYDELTEISIRE